MRIQSMNGVNINKFQFDYDLTWMAFFMDGRGRSYARYGGREDDDAESHLTKASLLRVMRRVLDLHRAGQVLSALDEPTGEPPRTPEEIPTMPAMMARRKEKCIHCHDVKMARLRDLREHDGFSREMIFGYPPPSAVGIAVDPDAQDRVRAVEPGSPADRAGLKAGDELLAAGGRRILSVGDFARVLDRTPDEATVPVEFRRGGEALRAELELSGPWRRTEDPSWRPSTSLAGPNAGFWAVPLNDDQKREAGIPADDLALKVTFLFPDHPTPQKAGLRLGDILVEFEGGRRPMTTRQLQARCQMHHDYGDKVPAVFLRDGRERAVTLELAERPQGQD